MGRFGSLKTPTISTSSSRRFRSLKALWCLCIAAILFVIIFALFSAPVVWYSDRLQDFLVNQGIISVPDDQSTWDYLNHPHLKLGKKLMAAHSLTIIGVGKNSVDNIVGVLHQITVLAGFFASSRAILIDGDSTDGSTKILQDWTNSSPSNRTLKVVKAPVYEAEGSLFVGQLLPREGRISLARNAALDTMATMSSTDYIIMLDLDIVGWNQMGVVDSFGRPSWDGICSNGVLLAGIFRDTYAFRSQSGRSTNHHLFGEDAVSFNLSVASRPMFKNAVNTAKKEAQAMMSEKNRPIEVQSCFGGLAIYRTAVVGACRYHHRHLQQRQQQQQPSQHPIGMVDCEHVLFSQCLTQTNKARIFSNPNMKLWYGHSSFKAFLRLDRVVSSILEFFFG